MNFKNIIFIIIVVILVRMFCRNKKKEKFTAAEMKRYPQMLDANCKYSTDMFNKLKKMNKKRCTRNTKGNTQRDTINNKTLCYDDTGKEIVSRLDMISYCDIAKTEKKQKKLLRKLDKKNMKKLDRTLKTSKTAIDKALKNKKFKTSMSSTMMVQKQSDFQGTKPDEGPEFINTFYMQMYDPLKTTGYASYTLDKPLGVNNKYANVGEYSDIGFSSDPAFLYRLANKSK